MHNRINRIPYSSFKGHLDVDAPRDSFKSSDAFDKPRVEREVGREGGDICYIPSYTFVYFYIPLCTFIYFHIHQNIQY